MPGRRETLRALPAALVAGGCLSLPDGDGGSETVNPALAGTARPTVDPRWSTTRPDGVVASTEGLLAVDERDDPSVRRLRWIDPTDGSRLSRTDFRRRVVGVAVPFVSEAIRPAERTRVRRVGDGSVVHEVDRLLRLVRVSGRYAIFERVSVSDDGPTETSSPSEDATTGDERTYEIVDTATWSRLSSTDTRPSYVDSRGVLLTGERGGDFVVESREPDGGVQWSRELASSEDEPEWIATVDDAHLVASADRLVALSRTAGRRVSTTPDDFSRNGSAVTTDRRLYLGFGRENDAGVRHAAVATVDTDDWSLSRSSFDAETARPVTFQNGPVVQFGLDGDHWVAAFSSTLSTRRWRRPGVLVGTADDRVYLRTDDRLEAVASDGSVHWRATPTLGGVESSSRGPVRTAPPTAFYDDVVVTTGVRGVAAYDAADGRERLHTVGVRPLALRPSPIGNPDGLPANTVVVETEERLHAFVV